MNDRLKVEQFYLATLYDMLNGTSITEIELILKDFEEEEMYEECEGIYKALELVYNGKSLKDIQLEYTDTKLKQILKEQK